MTAGLRAFYWRIPTAWRLFPMLFLDACFAVAFGAHALRGESWPPILWPTPAEGHATSLFLQGAIGGYMLVGAVLMMTGLTLALSGCVGRVCRIAVYGSIAGMWFLWSAYAVSLVVSVHHLVDTGFVDGWSHVTLWLAETVFLGIVMLAAYFDPRYAYFSVIAGKDAE